MSNYKYHNPAKEIEELRSQLSYSKRIGFFLGAGCSKALGISDVKELTNKVETLLKNGFKKNYTIIKNNLKSLGVNDINIEDILNQIRSIRHITKDNKSQEFNKISGVDAKELDINICNSIYEILKKEQETVDLEYFKKFVGWLNWLSRDYSKDLFTTNYDLLLEKAFENARVPFFDGFIGADEPFFLPESLERYSTNSVPPTSWIKLWKLHGSLGWFWKKEASSSNIVRLGSRGKELKDYKEIVIYPSRDKYESSRKQPFISYFDRLKSFLQQGEGLFVISGYSFSDDHINSIIFDGIKQNNRLHVMGFFYENSVIDKINDIGDTYYNFSAYGPQKAILNGNLRDWDKNKSNELLKNFWDKDESLLKLGDFKELIDFLLLTSGERERITSKI